MVQQPRGEVSMPATKGKASVQTAEENRESAELLALLADSVQDYAIILLDPQGRVNRWSPTAERLKGYPPKEILGKHFSIFYPQEDVANGKPERELEVAMRTGRFEDEGWRVRKDGSRFWANVIMTPLRDADGKVIGFGKVTRDFTERKHSEDLIRKQSQDILEMATVPVVAVWDGVLLVPLIGMLDSERTQKLMEKLLERLTSTASRVALIDVTGVPAIDTQTAQHLIETIKAVRFVGADVVITGISPTIARTLVHLGVDLMNVPTRSSLTSGLRVALGMLGLEISSTLA